MNQKRKNKKRRKKRTNQSRGVVIENKETGRKFVVEKDSKPAQDDEEVLECPDFVHKGKCDNFKSCPFFHEQIECENWIELGECARYGSGACKLKHRQYWVDKRTRRNDRKRKHETPSRPPVRQRQPPSRSYNSGKSRHDSRVESRHESRNESRHESRNKKRHESRRESSRSKKYKGPEPKDIVNNLLSIVSNQEIHVEQVANTYFKAFGSGLHSHFHLFGVESIFGLVNKIADIEVLPDNFLRVRATSQLKKHQSSMKTRDTSLQQKRFNDSVNDRNRTSYKDNERSRPHKRRKHSQDKFGIPANYQKPDKRSSNAVDNRSYKNYEIRDGYRRYDDEKRDSRGSRKDERRSRKRSRSESRGTRREKKRKETSNLGFVKTVGKWRII